MLCIILIKNDFFRRGIIGIIMIDIYIVYDDYINVLYLCIGFDIFLWVYMLMYV